MITFLSFVVSSGESVKLYRSYISRVSVICKENQSRFATATVKGITSLEFHACRESCIITIFLGLDMKIGNHNSELHPSQTPSKTCMEIFK